MFRRTAIAAVLLAVCSPMLPAHAAKSTTLFFANPGDDKWAPVLQTTPDAIYHENSTNIVVAGQGGAFQVSDDVYASSKKLSFKIDTSRKVTGTVYAMCQQVIAVNAATQRNAGYVDLSVSFKLDSTKIGSVALSGPVAPTMTVSKAFSFAIPAAFKNKVVKKVTATVTWTTTLGLCSISYTDPGQSQIVIPVK
ncbi:MAG: hypothetical protein QOE45_2055 [Frankiaceae bacterium]|jgi:hypothetical protein|nr:hypothetical protein [Frankiaceae bacterium]